MGDAAFEAAARVLPNLLRDAIESKMLRKIEEALQGHERTYRIFPEREPDAVKVLAAEAHRLAHKLRQEATTSLEELLKPAMKAGADRITALDTVAKDLSVAPGVRDLASEELAPLRKDQQARDRRGLAKLLRQINEDDEAVALDRVISDCADWGVRQLAIKKLKTLLSERDAKRMMEATGCISVEAVIKALPRVLVQAQASGDVMELEHCLGNLRTTRRLAGERGIKWPSKVADLAAELQADYQVQLTVEKQAVEDAIAAAICQAEDRARGKQRQLSQQEASEIRLEDALGIWNCGCWERQLDRSTDSQLWSQMVSSAQPELTVRTAAGGTGIDQWLQVKVGDSLPLEAEMAQMALRFEALGEIEVVCPSDG